MRVVIQGKMSDGKIAPQELVSLAGWVIEDTTIAIINNGEIVPLRAGTTSLVANIGGIKTTTTLIVAED